MTPPLTPHGPGKRADLLADRYVLVEAIGAGGTAKVWRAWDAEEKVFRAVKILDQTVRPGQRLHQRLAQEAELMARLSHPNVVRWCELGADGSRLFLVMELVEGGSVADRLTAHGPIPPRMAARVIEGVLAGLGAAHAQGIVHRDVKPHNLLLDLDGTPRVTDFGIARHDETTLTRTGAVLGTVAYMPPEQKASSRDVDHRADLYAVGATMYAMLTATDPHDLFAASLDPDIAEQRLGGLPAGLGAWIRKATSFRVEDRFADASEMAQALTDATAELPEDPPSAELVTPERAARLFERGANGPTLMAPTDLDGTWIDVSPSLAASLAPPQRTVEPSLPPRPRRRLLLPVLVALGLVLAAASGAAWRLWPSPPELASAPATLAPLPPVAPAVVPTVAAAPVLAPVEPAPAEPTPARRKSPAATPVQAEPPPAPAVVAPPPPREPAASGWRVAPVPDGRFAGFVATLEAERDVVDADGAADRPMLVVRCDKAGLEATLATGLVALASQEADPTFVALEIVVDGERMRRTVTPSRAEPGLLALRGDRRLLGRLLSTDRVTFRYTSFLGARVEATFRSKDAALKLDLEQRCP